MRSRRPPRRASSTASGSGRPRREHVAVVDGDERSAADRGGLDRREGRRATAAMLRMDALYPRYGFSSHVGYITPRHSRLVREHGPCHIHRRSFQALCYLSEEDRSAARRGRLIRARSGRAPSGAPCGTTGSAATACWTRTSGSGGYELDLVLRRGRTIVFCEVKAKGGEARRRSARDGHAGEGAPATGKRLRRVARGQPAACAGVAELRFDVAAEQARAGSRSWPTPSSGGRRPGLTCSFARGRIVPGRGASA